MSLISKERTKLARYRVEMRTSIIFDVLMPESATEEEVTAQASIDYRNLLERNGGITLNIGLPDCRLYMYTTDDWNPLEIGIADIESCEEGEEEEIY